MTVVTSEHYPFLFSGLIDLRLIVSSEPPGAAVAIYEILVSD